MAGHTVTPTAGHVLFCAADAPSRLRALEKHMPGWNGT